MSSPLPWMAAALVSSSLAFAYVEIGDKLPNPELARVDGGRQALLPDGKTTLFIFFDPDHGHCRQVLGRLAELQAARKDAAVAWVGVVNDRIAADRVKEALTATGARLDTLVDAGDKLYGELGVRLLPSIGIADSGKVLRAYLPYEEINYSVAIEAHLRRTLGEIDDAALQAALNPKKVEINSAAEKAQRNLTMARKLQELGKLDPALDSARRAVAEAPDFAEAHAVTGSILAAKGDCVAAKPELARALELDAANATAQAALAKCP